MTVAIATHNSRSDIRNLTFVELMLLVAFIMIVMLTTAFSQLSDSQKLAQDAKNEIETLKEERELLQKERDALRREQEFASEKLAQRVQEMLTLSRELADLRASISILEQEREDIRDVLDVSGVVPVGELGNSVRTARLQDRELIAELNEKFDALRTQVESQGASKDSQEQMIAQLTDRITGLLKQVRRKDTEINGLESKLSELSKNDASSQLASELAAAVRRVSILEDLLVETNRQVQVSQFGKPLCLIGPGEEQKYLFNVTMFDRHFNVTRAWPDEWNEKVIEIENVVSLASGRLSIGNFRKKADSIFRWGLSRGECRFIVNVFDRTSDKATYVKNLDIVEKYFFKRLM